MIDKEQKETKVYNYGLDLLRIVSMYFIIVLHVLGQGGILDAGKHLSINYEVSWFMEIGAYCAVNCYALISGYVGYYSKFRYCNIVKIYLQVTFYTVIITILFDVISPELVSVKEYIKAIFPFAFKQYWYFTAYFCMFLFIPFLKILIDKLERKQAQILIMTCFFLFVFLPTIFQSDLFYTKQGYSPVWLAFLYIFGGYINKYKIGNKRSVKFYFGIYMGSIVFTWLSKLMLELVVKIVFEKVWICSGLVTYISPTILLSSYALVLLFSKLELNDLQKGLVRIFAPLSFGVYLIHTHPLVWDNILAGRFVFCMERKPLLLVFSVLGVALGILVVCLLVDYIRLKVFQFSRIYLFAERTLYVLKMKIISGWNKKKY